jgi:N-acyl-D-amino-acid deacylase
MIDFAIRNGWIIDGTRKKQFRADIGVVGEKIVEIGRVPTALNEINASGLVVSPGFVDPHSHSDFTLHSNRESHSTIRQGVTTEIVGNCGFSSAPLTDESVGIVESRLKSYAYEGEVDWRTFDEYLDSLESGGVSANVASFVGHNSIRAAAGLVGDEAVTDIHLRTMKGFIAEAMEAGALGLSTGLEYAPGRYCSRSELEFLVKETGRHNGIYTSHVRNRDSSIFESIQEFLDLARIGDLPAQISHFNVRHDTNAPENAWKRATEMMMDARRSGMDVEADTTPFKTGIGKLTAILPEWLLKDGFGEAAKALKDNLVRDRLRNECDRYWRFVHKGQWDRLRLSTSPNFQEFKAMSFPDIAKIMKKDEWETTFDILMEAGEAMDEIIVVGTLFTEEHLAEMISHPEFSLGVDGYTSATHGPLSEITVNQQAYCGHIEYLAHHVREMKTLTLEDAIYKMAAKPAKRFGLSGRGEIATGNFADLVVFDAANVRTRSTVEEPRAYPDGIRCVIVNGTIVVDNGIHSGKRPGKVLRRN